jgi:hypothetical protein
MGTTAEDLLQFVSDPGVKDQLRADLDELHNCMECRQWKASIVFVGSLIEAVLYHHIEGTEPIRAQIAGFDKRSVGLSDLLHWARKYGVIDNNLFKLADSIRDYRNLIHPRVQKRMKVQVTEYLVQVGYGVLLEVVRQVNLKHRTLLNAEIKTIVSEIVESVCDRPVGEADLQVYGPILQKYGRSRGALIVERSIRSGLGED